MGDEQIVLPIWHNISRDDLIKISPSLTDRIALNTGTNTLAEIADELVAAVRDISGDGT